LAYPEFVAADPCGEKLDLVSSSPPAKDTCLADIINERSITTVISTLMPPHGERIS
jgi:hypothetical protein